MKPRKYEGKPTETSNFFGGVAFHPWDGKRLQASHDSARALQDPYSKTAQEKARLEAQQRLMGIDTNKKPKKKTKKKMLVMKS